MNGVNFFPKKNWNNVLGRNNAYGNVQEKIQCSRGYQSSSSSGNVHENINK